MNKNNTGIILFVDDETNILKSLKRELQETTFKMMFTTSGAEALKIMRETEVAVIVADLSMPDMSGLELLRIVNRSYPQTVRIILTGHKEVSTILHSIRICETHRYITKPWNADLDLLPTLRQSMELHSMLKEIDKYENKINLFEKKIKIKNEELKVLVDMLVLQTDSTTPNSEENKKNIKHALLHIQDFLDSAAANEELDEFDFRVLNKMMMLLNKLGVKRVDNLLLEESQEGAP